MNITVSDVRIPLAEAEQSSPLLALRVYTREGDTAMQAPYPVVVLCHGFCGVQGLLLPDIACRFVHEGYVVVTFDYRGFGDSGGERGRITPAGQQEDILAVLHWVLACPVLDEGRVALWGAGLGGGHVLCIAAMTPWVRCPRRRTVSASASIKLFCRNFIRLRSARSYMQTWRACKWIWITGCGITIMSELIRGKCAAGVRQWPRYLMENGSGQKRI
ncbi:hypothetical protein P805_01826 [Serratia marcescens BIDMC 44]|nr:hypothetical protein P805_01826 [Serratia marcescens BIDMC 44]